MKYNFIINNNSARARTRILKRKSSIKKRLNNLIKKNEDEIMINQLRSRFSKHKIDTKIKDCQN